nr:MAG TPA: Loader and inhibitor of phage G40P [Caudoviricetes sp.]
MEKSQVRNLLKTLRLRYPEYYARKTKKEIIDIFNSFVVTLADVDQIAVAGALDSYFKSTNSNYPPTAAQLKSKAMAMPEYMWKQAVQEMHAKPTLQIETQKRTKREILLSCALLIAMYDVNTKEELVKWWNEYADSENTLTQEEVETIWNKRRKKW